MGKGEMGEYTHRPPGVLYLQSGTARGAEGLGQGTREPQQEVRWERWAGGAAAKDSVNPV